MRYENVKELIICFEGEEEIDEFTDFIVEAFNDSHKPGFRKMSQQRMELIERLYSTLEIKQEENKETKVKEL